MTKRISCSPLKNRLSPTPPSPPSTDPLPLLKVPQRQLSGKKKSSQSSVKNKPPSVQKYAPSVNPSTKKPNLHLLLSPFNDEDNHKNIQIKSPRSLPTESFNFLKKMPATTPTPKGSQFIRSSKYRLPPNFSSSSERPKGSGSSWLNNAPARPRDLKFGSDKKGRQFNSPSAKNTSFDKIKLPSAHKGLGMAYNCPIYFSYSSLLSFSSSSTSISILFPSSFFTCV